MAGNPTPDLWDSANDMKTLLAAGSPITLTPNVPNTLPAFSYTLDKTKDLVLAFDISPTDGAGRRKAMNGPVFYSKNGVQEAEK
jgi:hypothetical protein